MAQVNPENSTPMPAEATRRRFLSQAAGIAAGGAVLALATIPPALAAAAADPIFALIDAHKLAQAKLKTAEAAHAAVERDLQARGLLFPKVSIPELDAMRDPSEQAMNEAYDTALETLDTAVETVPATMAGVMALLELQRDLWELNEGMFDRGHLSFICESVETALQNLRTA